MTEESGYRPPNHASLLVDGHPRRLSGDRQGEWDVRRVEIGEFVFEGLVVGDLLCGDYNTLEWPANTVMPQRAEAFSVMADLGPEHSRTCLLGLRFSHQTIKRWETTGVFCSVDAGVAGFVSADRVSTIDGDEGLLQKCESHLAEGVHLELDGRSFVLGTSGWGDGSYEVHWGLAADGSPAWVAIDFDILIGAVAKEFELALPLERGTQTLVEGLSVRVGLFTRWKPVLSVNLPQGQSAFAHVVGRDGPEYPKAKHAMLGSNQISYDLSGFKSATTFVVRHTLRYEPMDIVD